MPELRCEFGDPELTNEPVHTFILKQVQQHSAKNPSKKAYIDVSSHDSLTFTEVIQVVNKAATFLHQNGLRKGDCVMVCLNNCVYLAPFFLATLSRGAFVTGVNPAYTADEIARQMKDSECRFVLTEAGLLDRIFEAMTSVPGQIQQIIVTKSSGRLPEMVVDIATVLRTTAEPTLPVVTINAAEDLACLPYSSGTTGMPKGVMLTHRNWTTMMKGHEVVFNKATKYSVDPPLNVEEENQIWFMPNFHVYGLFMCHINLYFGATTAVLPHFDQKMFLQTLQDYKVRAVNLVPPIVVFLAKSPLVDEYNLSSLQWVSSGAAPLGRDLCEQLQARLPHISNVNQGYGMTEMSLACALPVVAQGRFGNSGKTAPNCVNKVLGPDEPGELCTRGPCVMKGYWKRPDATALTIDDQGWLHSGNQTRVAPHRGDIAYYDKNECIYIVDRLKELIKVKGFQVPPAELEGVLLSHPAVADAAVIGVPDMESGELPRAFVVRKPNSGHVTADHLKDFVRGKVAYYKQLKAGVMFVDEIPKSASGKILRRLLKQTSNTTTSKL